MRSLTANAQTAIATKLGKEPIMVVEIEWTTGKISRYADAPINGIPARILEMGSIDNVTDFTGSSSIGSVSLVLADPDNEIKNIIDQTDVHQRPVRIYQMFAGMSDSDKILVFTGRVNSPMSWSLSARTFSFSVLTQVESREIGFSAEEGDFDHIPSSMIGKAWPMVFGHALDIPAIAVNSAVRGSTLCGVGILSGADLHNQVALGAVDCSIGQSIGIAFAQISFLNACAVAWRDFDSNKYSELLEQGNDLRTQITDQVTAYELDQLRAAARRAEVIQDALEQGEGCNPLRILGGEDFPQGTTLTLRINGGLYTGTMHGNEFTISERAHEENEAKAQATFNAIEEETVLTGVPNQYFDFQMDVPPGRGDFLNTHTIRRHGFIFCGLAQKSKPSHSQVARHNWADAGAQVTIASGQEISYIVSITPGTVTAVKAEKTFEGETRLVNVPRNLWTATSRTYGPVTARMVTLQQPLSSIPDEGWGDTLYVSFNSTIGPNAVEIMQYIIQNYTDLQYDSASFAAASSALSAFPMGFMIASRPNALDFLKQLAFQSRCALLHKNEKLYLKYLPTEPSSDKTISFDDIDANDISVEGVPSEELITKMVINWRYSYAPDMEERIVLRNNEAKYGTHEQSYDFFAFNRPDIIYKVATFWLIRKSNSWKRLKFRARLNLLELEEFDTIDFDLDGLVGSGTVKGIVEEANYDSINHEIQFTILTNVRMGSLDTYELFWPGNSTLGYPRPQDLPNVGGATIGALARGALPIGDTTTLPTGNFGIWNGGPNIVFSGQADIGDRNPGDVGFSSQPVVTDDVSGDLDNVSNPDPDLTLNFIDLPPRMEIPNSPRGSFVLDIRRTRVIDSDNPGSESTLSTFLHSINGDGLLQIDTNALFTDGTDEGDFLFVYDDEESKWGAGIAYLKDD